MGKCLSKEQNAMEFTWKP